MPGTLTEEDYYMENGKFVLTAYFHLKRERCCGSGCRHCPYEPKHLKGNTAVSSSSDYLLLNQS